MTLKQKPEQFEIFSSDDNAAASENKYKPFLSCVWGHEKVILMIIAFLTVALIAFSLGFEKGKRTGAGARAAGIGSNAVSAAAESAQQSQALPAKQETAADVKERKIELVPQVTVASSGALQEARSGYTIQVASYKTLSSAEREAERLKGNGFRPLVLSKGDFTIVCVGEFASKGQASEKMRELKKRYQDCFIRRL